MSKSGSVSVSPVFPLDCIDSLSRYWDFQLASRVTLLPSVVSHHSPLMLSSFSSLSRVAIKPRALQTAGGRRRSLSHVRHSWLLLGAVEVAYRRIEVPLCSGTMSWWSVYSLSAACSFFLFLQCNLLFDYVYFLDFFLLSLREYMHSTPCLLAMPQHSLQCRGPACSAP